MAGTCLALACLKVSCKIADLAWVLPCNVVAWVADHAASAFPALAQVVSSDPFAFPADLAAAYL